MMYFEDTLWLRENLWKNTIGTTYFALGLFGIAFNLIVLSILPEISNFLTKPITILVSAQCFSSIFQFLAVFISVPSMIAVNKPFFINEVIIDVPAFILIDSQVTAVLLMALISVYRNLKIISPRASSSFINENAIYCSIFAAGCYSFYFSIHLFVKTTIRRFNLHTFGWNLSQIEILAFTHLAVIAVVLCWLFHMAAFGFLIYRNLFVPIPEDEKAENRCLPICSNFWFLMSDTTFAFIFCSSFLLNNSIFTIFQVFLTAYWPLVSSIFLDVHIRSALIYRTRGIFQPQNNAPIIIRTTTRNGNSNNNESKITLF